VSGADGALQRRRQHRECDGEQEDVRDQRCEHLGHQPVDPQQPEQSDKPPRGEQAAGDRARAVVSFSSHHGDRRQVGARRPFVHWQAKPHRHLQQRGESQRQKGGCDKRVHLLLGHGGQ
jgi:hypothetical protein